MKKKDKDIQIVWKTINNKHKEVMDTPHINAIIHREYMKWKKRNPYQTVMTCNFWGCTVIAEPKV